MMSTEFSASRLDVPAFVRAGTVLQGQEPLACYPRLAEEAQPSAHVPEVTWRALGELRAGAAAGAAQPWLHLNARVTLPLVCQRCLGQADTLVEADRWFRFVADERQAEAEDAEAEEDLLVLARDFDLHTLIEDELIMALPLVPRHPVCPVLPQMAAADADAGNAPPSSTHQPFAALAGLVKVSKTD